MVEAIHIKIKINLRSPNWIHYSFDFITRHYVSDEVLEVSDDLSKVLDKYTFTILQGKALERTSKQNKPAVTNGDGDSLLDLATPSNSARNNGDKETNKKSNLEELGDIFSTVDNSKKLCESLEVNSVPTLQPISLITSGK